MKSIYSILEGNDSPEKNDMEKILDMFRENLASDDLGSRISLVRLWQLGKEKYEEGLAVKMFEDLADVGKKTIIKTTLITENSAIVTAQDSYGEKYYYPVIVNLEKKKRVGEHIAASSYESALIYLICIRAKEAGAAEYIIRMLYND